MPEDKAREELIATARERIADRPLFPHPTPALVIATSHDYKRHR
jgi:hypothetical protein